MIACLYKKTFLKDLTHLPSISRKKIEKLVFREVNTSPTRLLSNAYSEWVGATSVAPGNTGG